MIFINLAIDNFYTFEKFNIDFTFPRKLSRSIIENECLVYAPKIKYKRVNIIMGANASGKTALGKFLCSVQNFLIGRSCTFINNVYDKDKKASFKIIFVINNYMFEYELEIENHNIKEKLRHIKLLKDYNLKAAFKALDEVDFFEETIELENMNDELPILSKVCDGKFKSEVKYKTYFLLNMPFYYRFASFTDKSKVDKEIDDELLFKVEKNLKIIDNSVKEVRSIISKDLQEETEEEQKDYYIIFKNGDKILVKDGDIKNIENNRLSQGTIESIELSYIISDLYKYPGVVYLDEQMAYMHTKLSSTMILKLIEKANEIKDNDIQIFITTHNENELDLNIPIHSFTFLVRGNDGTMCVNPEKKLNKNDRKLIEYVQNNYFNTNPDLDDFWE